MERILRGIRLGGETPSHAPDAHLDQEAPAMYTAPAHYAPIIDAEEIETDEAAYIPAALGVPLKRSDVLKVSSRSRPSAVAGAIAGVVRESGRAEVQAIGAGAANQAIKAVAIARDYLAETGINAVCLPSFIDVVIDEEDRTALSMVVEPR